MNYDDFFADALARLWQERRYRVFVDLVRIAGRFPHAVPVENQIRTYSWCNPPRIGRQRIRPALFTVRDRGASLSKAKCVRVSL
jgi:hypothetical protein